MRIVRHAAGHCIPCVHLRVTVNLRVIEAGQWSKTTWADHDLGSNPCKHGGNRVRRCPVRSYTLPFSRFGPITVRATVRRVRQTIPRRADNTVTVENGAVLEGPGLGECGRANVLPTAG